MAGKRSKPVVARKKSKVPVNKKVEFIKQFVRGGRWETIARGLKISLETVKRWRRQDEFKEELKFRNEMKVLESGLLADANRSKAVRRLIRLMNKEEGETQRRACADILKQPRAFAESKQKQPATPEPLREDRARELLARSGERRNHRFHR